MTTTECPCKNCVVFVMCKQRVRTVHNNQVTKLSGECVLLSEFIHNRDTGQLHDVSNVFVVREVFNLDDTTMGRL